MSESLLPPVIAQLRGENRDLLDKIRQVGDNLKGLASEGATHMDRLKATAGTATAAFGGFATGAGAALEHLGHQAESAHLLLETAINNSGKNYEDFSKQIDQTVSHMEHFGHTGADTQEALARLTNALQDPKKALDDMGLASEIAAVRHVSLTSAADMLVKAHAGSGRVFKQFGIDVKTAGDGTEALAGITDNAALKAAHLQAAFDELGQRLKGNAAAQADTFGGHLSELKAKITDIAASIGEKVGPALTMMGPALLGVSAIIKSEMIPSLLGMASAAAAVVAPLAVVALAAKGLYDAFNSHPKAIIASAQAMHDMTQGAMQEMIAKAGEAHKANSDLFAAPDMQKNFNNALADSVDTAQRFIDAMAASGMSVDAYREQLARKAQSDGFNKMQTELATAADKAAADQAAASAEADKAAATEKTNLGKEIDTISDKYGAYAGALVKATGMTSEQMKIWQTDAAKTESAVQSGFKGMEDALAGFSGQAVVTADDVEKSFKKQISDANHWAGTLRSLIDAGVDQSILAPLEAAGPKAAGYAQGLLDLVGKKGVAAVNDMGTNVGKIEDTMSSYAATHSVQAELAGKAWNDAFRFGMAYHPIGFTASTAGSTGGIATSLHLQALADGGWVNGAPGAPVPVIAHGGEFVLSADMLAGRSGGATVPMGGGMTIVVNVAGHVLSTSQLAADLQRELLVMQRSSPLGFTP